MTKYLSWTVIVAIGLQVAGCYTDYGPVQVAGPPPAREVTVTRLQPGDRVKVIIYGEDNLSGTYDIDSAGYISMPLVGNIRAAGSMETDLARLIANRYKNGILNEPKVTVSIVELRPFYIFGEVRSPGQYPYRSGLNVLTAASTAGGFTYRASQTTVLVRHAGEDLWKEYPLSEPIAVAPGDLIRVPERYF
jgi:protein involved in polysaccharide export with SLBB domain